MIHLELRHLRTLAALRDTGSLVDAADRLFLTQSALSHQVKDLEDRIGCALFFRKTKPVRFSSAGEVVLDLADRILPDIAAAERELERLGGGEVGRLHMAIECHSCFDWLMPAIERYRDVRSEVELDLAGGFNFDALPALAQGDLDLVVTSDPQDLPGIVYEPLFRYQAMLALGKQHPLAGRRYMEPQDLAAETLILYPVDRDRLDIFRRFLQPAGVEPGSVRQAELTPMIVQLVASGRGVACLPNWALHEYIARDLLVAVPLGEEGLWCTLYAAVRADDRASPYMDEFLTIARDTCFDSLVGIARAS